MNKLIEAYGNYFTETSGIWFLFVFILIVIGIVLFIKFISR